MPLLLGFVLDQILGDSPSWPHPVRWLGRLIAFLEAPLRRWLPERLGGVVLLLLVAGTAGGLAWALLVLTALCHPWANLAATTLLIYFGLAARSLARETAFVLEACDRDDWPEARRRLARIVGRDTEALSPMEIYRACVETVAENTTDAVVAPLLFAALFGPIGLWLFKAISTLDSMVGHRNERYLLFGWASARADDLANFVPARLTWLLMALAALLTGQHGGAALRIGWRDGRKHPSPNSAWAEATMAGALGVRLGGASSYQGKPSVKPTLGDGEWPLEAATVRRAIRLMLATSWLTLAICVLLSLAIDGPPKCEIMKETSGRRAERSRMVYRCLHSLSNDGARTAWPLSTKSSESIARREVPGLDGAWRSSSSTRRMFCCYRRSFRVSAATCIRNVFSLFLASYHRRTYST
jgi:adenosylcobinamide-phosphate synthase